MFYSLGDCESVEKAKQIIEFVSRLSPKSNIIRIVDRDDRSPEEISDMDCDCPYYEEESE